MKWIGWMAKLAITVVTVSLLTILTTGYVVNTYIHTLLGSYNLPIAQQAPTFGGMIKGMLGWGGNTEDDSSDQQANGKQEDDATDGTAQADGKTAGLDEDSQSAGVDGYNPNDIADGDSDKENAKASGSEQTGSNTSGSAGGDSGEGNTPPEDAVSVMGGISSGSAADHQGALGADQQVVVTPDEMVAKKDELSSKEKEEVFAMLMSKLPQAEMQKMTEAMEGGLTEVEMIEIEQILSKYLDKTEYTKMMDILKS